MDKILEVKNLQVSFFTYAGEVQAVRNISFDLFEGETLAIVGESGSGKTVTAKSLLRLIKRPTGVIKSSSQIKFRDENIMSLKGKTLQNYRGGDVSMIFQDAMTSLNPTTRIGDQIIESILLHRKMSRKEARIEAIKMLNLVRIPNANVRVDEYPHQFSGGMRQRVMIAIALACNPKALIADEPTTALDVTVQAEIMQLIKDLKRDLGTAVLLITHDLGVVAENADRVAVMYGGVIVEQGSVKEIFNNPQHPYTDALLKAIPKIEMDARERLDSIEGTPPDLIAPPKGCPFAPRCKYCMTICKVKMPENTFVNEQHSTMCWLKHELATPVEFGQTDKSTLSRANQLNINERPKLLEVKHLKKYFKLGKNQILKAVDDVSFYIHKGETLGVVGESGCGKTTCGRTIMNLYNPTAGEVIFEGKNIYALNKAEQKAFKKEVQMIFQDPYASLNPRMTVADIIAEGLDINRIYQGAQRELRIHELLNMVGLNKEHANRFPHEFSGGQRQRVGIARALAVNPKLIICDEPISALDMSIQAQVINLLLELQNKFDLTYMFIAHDLSMVKYISDRVAVMHLGFLVELAESEKLYRSPLHPYTKMLMKSIPIADPDLKKEIIEVNGNEMPSQINLPEGCRFCQRCDDEKPICSKVTPRLKEVEKGHFVACHLYEV